MTDHLLFLIVGLGAGAAYAAIGMAVVTTYRGTGVINIAQGAMAMWAAFVYDELRRQGDLVLPVGRVDLGDGLATWPALAAGVAAVAVLGLLLHLVVFRPLRSAPPLAKVVASVGAAITLQALVVLRFGTGRRAVPPALPPSRSGAPSCSATHPTGSRRPPGCCPPWSAAPSPSSCRHRWGSSPRAGR